MNLSLRVCLDEVLNATIAAQSISYVGINAFFSVNRREKVSHAFTRCVAQSKKAFISDYHLCHEIIP